MQSRLSVAFSFCLCVALSACASAPPPRPVDNAQPAAADNGQPKMQAALDALHQAQQATEAATANKGGHREQAIGLISQAIQAVQAGMQYAASHPNEVGEAEGAAAPEPVNEEVAGAERQPHMAQAVVSLREARRQLREAKHDKGGFRMQALQLIQQAIMQLNDGIRFANNQ